MAASHRLRLLERLARAEDIARRQHMLDAARALAEAGEASALARRAEALIESSPAASGTVAGLAGAAGLRALLGPAAETAHKRAAEADQRARVAEDALARRAARARRIDRRLETERRGQTLLAVQKAEDRAPPPRPRNRPGETADA